MNASTIYECYKTQLHSMVSNVFFEQLAKVGSEKKNELTNWYKSYNNAKDAERIAFDASMTSIQTAFINYISAKSIYDKEFAKVVNNTVCSVPTILGTNDVIKGWNVDINDNVTTYTTANDLLCGMISKVAELTGNSLFTFDNIQAAGLNLDEKKHLTAKELGTFVSSLYADFGKISEVIRKENESFNIVRSAIDSNFSVCLRFVSTDRLEEAKTTTIKENITLYNCSVNVTARIWEHYGFAGKAAEIRAAAAKVENAAKVDYKSKVRLLVRAISDTTNRKNFKFSQLKHLYELSGYPLQPK